MRLTVIPFALSLILICLTFFVPVASVFADPEPGFGPSTTTPPPQGPGTGSVSPGTLAPPQGPGVSPPPPQDSNLKATLLNPLKPEFSSIPDLLYAILKILLQLAIPVAALIFMWSGFLFITAQGKPEKLKIARMWFYGAVIGTAILLGALTLATALKTTIEQVIR